MTLNISPFGVHNTKANDNALKLLHMKQELNLRAYLDNALVVQYQLTESEEKYLTEIFSPRPITYRLAWREPGKDGKFHPGITQHPHGAAATLNKFAYERCIAEAKRFGNSVIDIGGSPLRTPKEHHMCVKITDVPTDARYTSCAFMQMHTDPSTYDFRDYLTAKHSHCTEGAEHCKRPARYGYSVNVYDLDFKTIVQFFTNHNLLIYDMWMFLPYCLLDKRARWDQVIYTCTETIVDGQAHLQFSLNDLSKVYTHNYDRWKSYYETTKIQCANFAIDIEIQESYGTFCRLRFTRTERINGQNFRVVPLSKLSGLVIIPNVPHYIQHRAAIDFFTRAFVVKEEFINKVATYASAQKDDMYAWANFKLYANSCRNTVRYQSGSATELIYEGIQMRADEFEDLCISMYVVCAVSRFTRTKVIGNAFNLMRDNQPSYDFFKLNIWITIKQKLREAFEICFNDPEHIDVVATPNFIYNLHLKYFEDYRCDKVCYDDTYWVFSPYCRIASMDIIASPGGKFKVDKSEKTLTIPKEPASDGKHCRIIYDPPGTGGRCGFFALEHVLGKAMIIPPTYKNSKGVDVRMPTSWLNDEEMAAIAAANGASLIVHQFDKPIPIYHLPASTKVIRVNNNGAHWTVVECDCSIDNNFVGDYVDVPVDVTSLYINCANNMLADGGGQAAAFRRMFPNYDKSIKKPIGNYEFVLYDYKCKDGTVIKVHLMLCVAYDNSKTPDVKKTHEVYTDIFVAMRNHCLKYKLTPYLPALGTAIYATDLSCFKTHLVWLKKYVTVISCHMRKEGIGFLDKCVPCKHGGHKYLAIDLQDEEVDYDVEEYDTSLYNSFRLDHIKGKMARKFQDIYDAALPFIESTFDGDITHIVDLSAAPGDWHKNYHSTNAKNIVPYDSYVYIGDNSFDSKIPNSEVKGHYTELPVLIKQLHVQGKYNKPGVLYIYDNEPTEKDCDALYDLLRHRKDLLLITKFSFRYDDMEALKCFNARPSGIVMHLVRSNFSNATSSEIYVIMHWPVGDVEPTKELSLSNVLQMVDEHSADLIDDGDCCGNQLSIKDVNSNYTIYAEGNETEFDFFKLKCMRDQYVKKSKDCLKYLETLRYKDQIIDIPCVNGVGGSGKTRNICVTMCQKCTAIVAPYRAVVQGVNNDTKSALAMTYMAAVERFCHYEYKYVVFDECFAFSPIHMYLLMKMQPNAKFLAIGDHLQINDRNYDNDTIRTSCNFIEGKKYHTLTHRCPQLVVEMLQNYIPGMKTTSKIRGSILRRSVEEITKIPKTDVLLVGTQKSKEHFIAKKPSYRVNTINAEQGKTYRNVHIYTPDVTYLPEDMIRYVYVAMSRATHQIVTYGTDQEIDQFFHILGTPIERALDAHDIIIAPTVELVQVDKPPKLHTQVKTLAPESVNAIRVDEILSRVYIPTNDPYSNVIDYKSDIIPDIKSDEKFKTSIDLVTPDATKIKARRLGKRGFHKYYHPKNTKQMIDCMITRYAKEDKHIPKKYIDMFIKGFDRWMKVDWKSHLRKQVNNDLIQQSVRDYLVELQKKFPKSTYLTVENMVNEKSELICPEGDYVVQAEEQDLVKKRHLSTIEKIVKAIIDGKIQKLTDLSREYDDSYNKLVQFHLKRQSKEVRKAGYDAEFKAGQGISAWSKLINVIIAGITRTYVKLIPDYILPNVQLSYGKSDANIAEWFKKFAAYINDKNFEKLMNDFGEFDSSQESQGVMASCMILLIAGFNYKVVCLYLDMRSKWLLANHAQSDHGFSVFTCLAGVWKQHSGQPFTLDGNTMFNMSVMGFCYDYEDLICAAFKGDDSLIVCGSAKPVLEDLRTLHSVLGYKMKEQRPAIPEYIANIVHRDGFFPDVLRRVSNVQSKLITENKDWVELRKSILDCLDVVPDDDHLMSGCQVASLFYQQFNIVVTPDEVRYLVSYLRHLTQWEDFESIPVEEYSIETIKQS